MAWIESHQSLARHRKTLRAASLLKTDRHKLIGHLHELWWWGLDNADIDGVLLDIEDDEIASAAGWPVKDASTFTGALVAAGFIDQADGRYALHNWYKYAGKLNVRRATERERAKIRRSSSQNPQDVARTSAVHPQDVAKPLLGTVPNLTVPNLVPKGTKAAVAAPSKRITDSYLQEIAPKHPTVNVYEVYEDARNRKVWDGYKDQRRALGKYIGWAEEKAAQPQPLRGNGNGRNIGDSTGRTAKVGGFEAYR